MSELYGIGWYERVVRTYYVDIHILTQIKRILIEMKENEQVNFARIRRHLD